MGQPEPVRTLVMMNRIFGNISDAKLQKANHQFGGQSPDVVITEEKMERKSGILVRNFLGGVMGWVEEKRKRYLKNRVDLIRVGTRNKIRSDDRNKRCDQIVVERNNLVNLAKAFHLFGSESDFLFALPKYGFKRRAILGILLASGKGDLSGV